VIGSGVSSGVATCCDAAVGGLLTVTLIDTVPSLHSGSGLPFVVPLSHAVYVKVAGPLYPSTGT
jgi:hypothetical protein